MRLSHPPPNLGALSGGCLELGRFEKSRTCAHSFPVAPPRPGPGKGGLEQEGPTEVARGNFLAAPFRNARVSPLRVNAFGASIPLLSWGVHSYLGATKVRCIPIYLGREVAALQWHQWHGNLHVPPEGCPGFHKGVAQSRGFIRKEEQMVEWQSLFVHHRVPWFGATLSAEHFFLEAPVEKYTVYVHPKQDEAVTLRPFFAKRVLRKDRVCSYLQGERQK